MLAIDVLLLVILIAAFIAGISRGFFASVGALAGLVLGVAYGWIAAQSLLGSVPTLPEFTPAGLVAPQIPWIPVAIIVVATAVLTLVAAATPTRLATRVAPVEALAAD